MIRLARLLCFVQYCYLPIGNAMRERLLCQKARLHNRKRINAACLFLPLSLRPFFKRKKAKISKGANLALTVNIENATNFWQPITCNAAEAEKEIGAAKRNEDTTGSRHCSIPSPVTNTIFLIYCKQQT